MPAGDGPSALPPFMQKRVDAMPERPPARPLGDAPMRLPQEDFPGLSHLLDDVVTLGFWVQRAALAWVPQAPRKEALSLLYLEMNLADLEHAANVARAKVEWRRKVAEAREEHELRARSQEALDERWADGA